MGPPNIKADAQRVFTVLKSGGIALIPADLGYALFTLSPAPLEKVFLTKQRGAHKRHPIGGTFALHQELHMISPLHAEIVQTLTQNFGIPMGIIAKYRPEHPLVKQLQEWDMLEASSDGEKGTVCMTIGVGRLWDELAALSAKENLPLQGSSANPTGTGNRYRLEDVPEEVRDIADIEIDYGLAKYADQGRGATLIDFSGEELEVVRIGAMYEAIRDKTRRFWGIELPEDPGREKTPYGHLKTLLPSESLSKLLESEKS